MQANQEQRGISDYAAALIRCKARQLVNKAGFTKDDVEDLEQEMTLDLLMRLPKFDVNKATQKTFVARLVERKISKLIRHRRQEMRDYRRRARSLNEPIKDEDGGIVERGDTIAEEEINRRLGRRSRTAQEDLELALDTAETLSRLPEHLRRLCELLKTGTIAEAARQLGIPRTTLNDHVRKLREMFEHAGLRDYL